MCYSGKCSWENHMGDCILNSKLMDKYKLYCEVPETKEEADFLESSEYKQSVNRARRELFGTKSKNI